MVGATAKWDDPTARVRQGIRYLTCCVKVELCSLDLKNVLMVLAFRLVELLEGDKALVENAPQFVGHVTMRHE
jgi:hypothetical protein